MRVIYDVSVFVSMKFGVGCVCNFIVMLLNWESDLRKWCESCINVFKLLIFFES